MKLVLGTSVTKTLNPANEWDVSFENLPKYKDGVQIIYNAVESDVANYKAPKYDFNAAVGELVITNSHDVSKVDISVTKEWIDANNQDGKRPESVQVTLHANGIKLTAEGTTVTLDASNNWSHTWEALYANYHGKPIVYTVQETATPAGYTSSVTGSMADGFVVTNTHTPEIVTIPVSKVWVDNDDQDGLRPEEIIVTLYADTVAVDTIKLTADTYWKGEFKDQPVYKDGKKIAYTIKEEDITGYTGMCSTDGNTLVITNTHEIAKTEITAIKVWNDNNNQDGKRPDAITVHLLANGQHTGKTAVITASDEWSYTWKKLDKFAAGQEILYTVYEEPVYFKGTAPASDGIAALSDTIYEAEYTRDASDPSKITITNTYIPETVEISATKVWMDGDNRDGLRPESITVEVLADNVATGKTAVLNEANNWSVEWLDLAKYRDQGVQIVYSVKETVVPDGYTGSVKEDTEFAPGMFILTNTHEPETTSVVVTKSWEDEDNNDGKRPDGIIVQLYANGIAVDGAQQVLSEDNRWSWEWNQVNDVPLYVNEDGAAIKYTVDEVGYVIDGQEYDGLPEGYTKEIAPDSYSVVITNTRASERIDISVEKVWEDDDNNDGIRPESITVKLLRNNTELASVELNEANGWKNTWTDLYKYVEGTAAVYTVEEIAVEGYSVSYSRTVGENGDVALTVTNTHENATKKLTLTKVWADNNNAYKHRPDSVQLQLFKNGEIYGDAITVSADTQWKAVVSVPQYEDGAELIWQVEEVAVPKYYKASYNQETLTVTNTHLNPDVPDTGDVADLPLWGTMMFASLVGAVTLLILGRKKKESEA